MTHLKQAQERYKQAVRKAQYSGANLPHNDSLLVSSDSLEAEDLNKPLSQFVESASRNNSLQLLNPFRNTDPDSVSMTSQMSAYSTTDTVCTTLSDSTQTFSSQVSPNGSPPKSTSPLLGEPGIGPGIGSGPGLGINTNTSQQLNGDGTTTPLLSGSQQAPLSPKETDDLTVTSAGSAALMVEQQQQVHLSPPRSPYNSARGQRWKLKAIHEKSLSKDTLPLSGPGGGGSGGGNSAFSEPTDVWPAAPTNWYDSPPPLSWLYRDCCLVYFCDVCICSVLCRAIVISSALGTLTVILVLLVLLQSLLCSTVTFR